MASTNSTTHYELSQYIGTDKPTYLVDYNQDMSKIDTGIYGAKSKADNNETSIGTLSSLQTSEKSNLVGAINEVKSEADGNKTNIGTLANLSTTDKSSLVGAVNEVKSEANTNKANIENFNLNTFLDLTNITATGCNVSNASIKCAKNSDGSLAKIYGTMSVTATANSQTIVIAGSGLAPTSDITINNAGIRRINDSIYSPTSVDITIKTNGNIEISGNLANGQVSLYMLLPMLYFIKDFGDVPIN